MAPDVWWIPDDRRRAGGPIAGVRFAEAGHAALLGPDDALIPLGPRVPQILPVPQVPQASQVPATAGNRGAGEGRAPLSRAGQAETAWLWNGAANPLRALRPEELERRLRREGFKSRLEGEWPGASDLGRDSGGRELRRGRQSRTRRELRVGEAGGESGGLSWTPAADVRRFEVSVFGLDEADVVPSPESCGFKAELGRRLGRASARALYVLGLDLGTVRWEVASGGRAGTIVGIDDRLRFDTPEANDRLRGAIARFAATWREELLAEAEATVGADPEFLLVSPQGRVVPASRYFSARGAAGCDAARVGGALGWPLAELRPEPARDPRDVLARLRRLLAAASARTAGAPLSFRAGSAPVRGLPLGGHLHLSGVALTGERLRALDNAVALPLRLLEPPEAGRRRPRYGSLGDYRPKPHGGFEYRTPPSWLVSPLAARGALALAKVAAESSRRLAADRPLDDDALRDAFYAGDRERLLAAAERVHAALRRTDGYAKHGEDIEPLFRAVRENRRWDETADIRRKWNIPFGR